MMRSDFKNVYIWIFGEFFFITFTYIFGHRDLDLWPKVTDFNRVWTSAISNHLAKTASKSVHPFGWNFVHTKSGHTDTHTDTQTNCSENITPPRFHGGVIIWRSLQSFSWTLLFAGKKKDYTCYCHKSRLTQNHSF